MDYPIGFYVYRLLDPRDGLPFYVGKGQRDRAWTHVRDVRAGKASANARKVARIEEILRFGHEVEVEVVAVYDLESEALDHEFRLVDECPTLTNMMPGGGGGILSAAAFAKRLALRMARLKKLRERERAEAVVREAEAKRRRIIKSVAEGAAQQQVAAWLDGLSPDEARKFLAPKATGSQAQADAFERKRNAKKPRRQRGRQSRRGGPASHGIS